MNLELESDESLLYRFGINGPRVALLRNRQVGIYGPIDDHLAECVMQEVMFLESLDPYSDITVNIMSSGGSINSGLAILDALNAVSCEITTIGTGLCASMGAFLLACAGKPGKRYITQNCEVMIHQPLAQMVGQQADIEIEASHMLAIRKRLDGLLAHATGKTIEEIVSQTDRNNWLTAEEAISFGIVDEILIPKSGYSDLYTKGE